VKEIRPGVWMIEGGNKGRYPFAHSIYVEGDDNLLIDTGAGQHLEEVALKTGQVVLSHYHRDHVTYNHLFKRALFSIHNEDAPGVESISAFFSLSGLSQIDIEAYWKMVNQAAFSATTISRYLQDGDKFDLGRFTLEVLHLPGHTPGHCGFMIRDYNLIFSADIDMTKFGPWYGNPSSDLEKFRQSIRRLRQLDPEVLLTGHSAPICKNIEQKLEDYESVLDQRDEAIIKIIKNKPLTLEQLTDHKVIYRHHFGQDVLRYFEQIMVQKHLVCLENQKLIVCTEQGFYEAL
jgi:glyoxylase-like metal-dependent hydrolase (beta-lactamase superfamily II)